jgi:hypothetical protein
LDNEFNWEEGLSKQEEDQLYKPVPELWPTGEVVPKKLHFLPEIDCGMIHMEEKNDHLLHFLKHESKKTLIFYEVVDIMIKNPKIVG